MPTATEFLEALRRTGASEARSVGDHWNRQRTQWIDELRVLRATLRGWMTPLVEAGRATVADCDFATTEPDLGYYMAPGLDVGLLAAEPRRLLVHPRGARVAGIVDTAGARVVGARGRVDIECGVNREILLRFVADDETAWCSFAEGKRRALDEELFFELLARVTEIPLK